MNSYLVNKVIAETCRDLSANAKPGKHWHALSEEELFFEAVLCICSSQVSFELAEATADHLRSVGLTDPGLLLPTDSSMVKTITGALEQPLAIAINGRPKRFARVRFKNRIASLLSRTIRDIYQSGLTIRDILFRAQNAKEARELLIKFVWGFGPKQSSLFLRRIGYSENLAILDTHVLDYLRLYRGIALESQSLGRLSAYEMVEDTFREVADRFGYPVGAVDLATWLTIRVMKREALI